MMKPDARITDIVGTLADPVEYVRRVLGSFIEHSFDKQRSSMTIGISGTGLYPNYFIQEPSETASARRRTVFNGQSHREILDDSGWGESWSSATMSFAEVQALLGDLRQFKKKRRASRKDRQGAAGSRGSARLESARSGGDQLDLALAPLRAPRT